MSCTALCRADIASYCCSPQNGCRDRVWLVASRSTKSMKVGLDADAHLQQALAGDIKRSVSNPKGSMFSSGDLDNDGNQQS